MLKPLTRAELDEWRGFRYMVEETSLAVSRGLYAATGLSGGQFGILMALSSAPLGSMRQQELANEMRWDRTRLSHQLTRMETSTWVRRQKAAGRITMVEITASGRNKLEAAAPLLGDVVREHFFKLLSADQLVMLATIRKSLAVPPKSE